MASKYIGIEEAAKQLLMTPEELNRLRELGDIRGFADRGTWKFRIEDVEELVREREPTSDLSVPMLPEDSSGRILSSDSPPLVMSDEGLGDQPTSIRKKSSEPKTEEIDFGSGIDLNDGATSDSDVALVSNEFSELDDSDVSLIPESGLVLNEQESGITFADSNLDLTPESGFGIDPGSDSDVALVDSSASLMPSESSIGAGSSSSDKTASDKTDPDQIEISITPDSDIILENDSDRIGSDSDVRLLSDSTSHASGQYAADSQVHLPGDGGSDSDIELIPEGAISDSDVLLVPDSDISIAQDSGISLSLDPDSDMTLGDGTGITLSEDSPIINATSGISLSGSTLDIDSGIGGDSGMGADSGISLASDSGISLELAADSGISLGGADDDAISLAAESGISLEPFGESGITLADSGTGAAAAAGIGATVPMMDAINEATAAHDENDTHVEFDVEEETFDLAVGNDDDDSAFDLSSQESDNTNVIMFDDDDDDDIDDDGDFVRKTEEEESVFDLDAADDDEFDMEYDVLGEDDELDELDVFDDDEDDLDADFDSASQPEFIAPIRSSAPAAPPWSFLDFSLVSMSTIAMGMCCLLMLELVHSMWTFNQPFGPSNILLDTVAGLFKP